MKKLLILPFLAFTVGAMAQTGTIRGTVNDGDWGGTAPFVNVYIDIDGTLKGVATDMNGNYTLSEVPVGEHVVQFSAAMFAKQDHTVIVESNEVIVLDVTMSADVLVEFIVEARRDQGGDAVVDEVQSKSASVTNVLGSKTFKQLGANDVTDAAKYVPAVTIEGGKYVYVRGLSDRYSKTTLNGAEIPGLDPNRNSVQLDLFPTNLVDRIEVVKTFRPDLPGSFTGGLLDITTKDFPDRFTIQVSTTLGYNTQSSFNHNFLTYSGGATDWLGFDDGTRDAPSTVQNSDVPALYEDNATLESITRSFDNNYEPIRKMPVMNHGFSFSIGNQLDSIFGNKFGFIAGVTYRHDYTYYSGGTTGRYSLTGNENTVNELNQELYINDSKGTDNVIWGALASMSYMIGNKHTLTFNAIRNQNGVTTARYQEGINPKDAPDLYYQTRTLQYLERSMNSFQLQGNHALGTGVNPFLVDWVGSFTLSVQDQPDLRFFTNDYVLPDAGQEDTIFNINSALYQVPARYWRYMEEKNVDTKINFTLPVSVYRDTLGKKESALKWGFSNVYKDRIFTESRYDFRDQNIAYNGDVNDYFSEANMDLSQSEYVYVQDATELRNSYTGTDQVLAGYAMGDLWLNPKLRVIAGARYEQTSILLISANTELPRGSLLNHDVLPSVNLSYSLTDSVKLRLGYSRTLARPTFRELAPFASFDFVGDYVLVGNANLQRTLIDNVDVRWEMYPKIGEIISASIFAKFFQNPIERAFNPIAANPELNYRNVEKATVYGAEFEFRKSLDFIAEGLKDFKFGLNVTYVYSRVNIDPLELEGIRATDPDHPEYRTMFGQSPYIINTLVSYNNSEKGWSANLSYNVCGPKLAVIIVGGTPNVFEQPRHVINFNINKQFNERFSVKLSVNNLLNSAYKQSHKFKGEEYIFQSYQTGQTFSIGLKYLIN